MGVLAVYGVENASTFIYYGLHNLQHRGQEGGGIVTFDENGVSHRYRGQGLLSEIFTNGELDHLPGSMGIGIVKYANASKAAWTTWIRFSSAIIQAISPLPAKGTW